MSMQSTIGKRAWRDRAPRYAAELRADIQRDASAWFAGWQARGHPPVWFRVKRRLRLMVVNTRAGRRS